MAGGQSFPFTGQEFPDEELLGSFVNLYYDQDNLVPKEILLPVEPEGLEALAADCASDGVYECLFVAKPLVIRGGVGSPANALAIK